MKFSAYVILAVLLTLVGCNSVGPFTGNAYSLDKNLIMISLDTWIGGDRSWPTGDETLKREAERVAVEELKKRGVSYEACSFIKFTPLEGGHITITLIAGERDSVANLSSLNNDSFYSYLRSRDVPIRVFQFKGRMNLD